MLSLPCKSTFIFCRPQSNVVCDKIRKTKYLKYVYFSTMNRDQKNKYYLPSVIFFCILTYRLFFNSMEMIKRTICTVQTTDTFPPWDGCNKTINIFFHLMNLLRIIGIDFQINIGLRRKASKLMVFSEETKCNSLMIL